MPRLARTVFACVPHHVVQRGNRRGTVFFSDEDCRAYLGWLGSYAGRHHVEILAYCLMGNHVHLVAVPATSDSLRKALKPLHMRHAQRINRARGWTGHLWQGRYFSSVLDGDYFWAAIRYVERNPVRAQIVARAEDYPWSSAAAHCGLRSDPVLTRDPVWRGQLEGIGDWGAWLAEGDPTQTLEVLRRNVGMGLPCGSDGFVRKLEMATGRALQFRPRGRPGRRRAGKG